jgi:mRNA interferase YafQ
MKRGLNLEHLRTVVKLLEENGSLPHKYRPHKLTGVYSGIWECHIEPDWLLLWKQDDTELVLLLRDTGTHADIF